MEDDKEKGIVDTTGDLNGDEGRHDKGNLEEAKVECLCIIQCWVVFLFVL